MPPIDPYPGVGIGPTDPARKGFAIEPTDDDLPKIPRFLYVGKGGDLALVLADEDGPLTFKNVADGVILPVRPKRVLSTGTTAGELLGLY